MAFTQSIAFDDLLFYSPDLDFSYRVNKKLNKSIEKLTDRQRIIRVTWNTIIDSIVETQSIWSLENMYLVRFRLGKNQNIVNAEYIGIPKLQASLLLEDIIRMSLNTNVVVNKNEWVWLLDEFIKNKPLYPVILRHVEYCVINNLRVNYRTSVYALCIDAKIREHQNTHELFSESFLLNYKQILWDVKDAYRSIGEYVQTIRQILGKDDCLQLTAAIRKGNKVSFVNYVLKKFLEKSHSNVGFIFRNIVNNDISWENYALSLVVGILGGVNENDSGESYEE